MSGQFLLISMVFLLHFLLQRLLFAYECALCVRGFSMEFTTYATVRKMYKRENCTVFPLLSKEIPTQNLYLYTIWWISWRKTFQLTQTHVPHVYFWTQFLSNTEFVPLNWCQSEKLHLVLQSCLLCLDRFNKRICARTLYA